MASDHQSGLEWLYGTQLFGIKLGLENVHRLLAALGLPGAGMKFIHVAGTNGKGSTCAFMHSILREAGIHAGLFTSPHLIRFNERIQDSARMISDDEIESGLSRLRALVQDWNPHPTFFELAFVLALDWFRDRGLEWVILETGMGGRLDATNAVTPAASVITSIGWDHMEILGDTLAKIALEKAGIIKPGVPVVTQAQPDEVQHVLQAEAARQSSPFVVVEPWQGDAPGLLGPHQRQNAALAVHGLRAAGLRISGAEAERGLASVKWPGRFYRVGPDQGLIIDGAHNLDAVRMLVETWQGEFPGEKAVVIFGVAGNKDVRAMLRSLAPIVKEWRFTAFRSPRAMPAAALQAAWQDLEMPPISVTISGGVAEALAAPATGRRLVAGSLYLVGEALALLAGDVGRFQASTQ
ncbi:MAG: folylpolyglutamate synthase/dihydrofolate synthase family protein [Prosthecobacter sp.]|nr:folylpolyglutamate synthase/dihydrofolate synthase family protein [Prosthecobacter sp.]